MPAPPPAVLWIDPGGMTGLASLVSSQFHASEHPFEQACDRIAGMCANYNYALAIGYERYTILPGTHKLSAQTQALEIIGVVRYLARIYHCQLLQPAQQHTPDQHEQAELRELGWWVPGQDDSQSAACHLLRWLRRANCLPPELARVLAQLR
jgi:hypothetical protein